MAKRAALQLTMGERLRVLRTRNRLGLREAAAAAQGELPPSLSMSHELLRRLESGEIAEDRANPVHLMALAEVYGVSVDEISPELGAANLPALIRLMDRTWLLVPDDADAPWRAAVADYERRRRPGNASFPSSLDDVGSAAAA